MAGRAKQKQKFSPKQPRSQTGTLWGPSHQKPCFPGHFCGVICKARRRRQLASLAAGFAGQSHKKAPFTWILRQASGIKNLVGPKWLAINVQKLISSFSAKRYK